MGEPVENTELTNIRAIRATKIRAGLKWFGALMLGGFLTKLVIEPFIDLFKGSAVGIWAAIGDAPIRFAASYAGASESIDVIIGALFLGVCLLTGILMWIVATDLWKLLSGKAVEVFQVGAWLIVGALVVTMLAGTIVITRQTGIRYYRTFHTNLDALLPFLSSQEERELRSRFARARTRADWKELEDSLRKRVSAASIPYFELD